MSSATDYLENKLLDHALGTTAYTAPTVYVALYTVAPTDGTAGTEVTNANGYTRKAVSFSAASGGATSNSGTVTFDTATGSWGTVVAMALVDSSTHGAGNQLMWAALDTSKAITTNDVFTIATGDLDITLD